MRRLTQGLTRRELLRAGVTGVVLAGIPSTALLGMQPRPAEPRQPFGDDPGEPEHVRQLVMRALDAAHRAGAMYADVRVTRTCRMTYEPELKKSFEFMTVGVRALVNGYWGFASGCLWTPDEMGRLGHEAVAQSKTNTLGKPRIVDLAVAPSIPNGQWVMPIEIDPFDVSPDEVLDVAEGLAMFAGRYGKELGATCNFVRQDKAFGSTAGSYLTQRLYRTEGKYTLKDKENNKLPLDFGSVAGRGWEYLAVDEIREAIVRGAEQMNFDISLPGKVPDVGRYEAVVDSLTMANLIDRTFGRATELDCAFGYEANATGTSYLNDPLEMLGSYVAAAPLLTVTANRSMPGGAATTRWDDEGVTPDDFTLIQQGLLTDFQTGRESASWLRDYDAKVRRPTVSHGCSAASSAIEAPLVRTPNLAVTPAQESLDFEGMIAGLTKGVAIRRMTCLMDVQNLNGMGTGMMYEISRGQRTARLMSTSALFRAPELWKNLQALGGPSSVARYGMETVKGQPYQQAWHTVAAVPARFRELALTTIGR